MMKRERFYDGKGNELRIDEINKETFKIQVNDAHIDIPIMKLVDMLMSGQTKGKHVKAYATKL